MSKNFIVGKYELDDFQMKLLNTDQNSLVIAGAGSGKTLTILGKINYLIENKKCMPEEILVISFTNASVNDIKTKIKKNVNVYTFHKLAISLLKKANYEYTLCSSNLLQYIVEEFLKTCDKKYQKTILKFLNISNTYNHFLNSNNYSSFCNLIITFINLYKTNNLSINNTINKKFTNLEKQILTIIFKIYYNYIIEKQSTQKFDFDDLIIYATKNIKNIKLNYKYIIIDEFQDTSLIRLELISEIQRITNSKIIVVGDDFQSIYRFSGCNLNIFLNFENLFKNVNKIKLVNTYRNSLELINIASSFIQKNPLQIKKNLISNKKCNSPLIFVPFSSGIKTLKKILNYLISITNDIMILSRNNKDIYKYIDNDFQYNGNIIIYQNINIKYYTVHRSKGLESEYVIVLNCNNELLGFPNKIENNILIEKLLPNNEMKYAEERRLFYVAITRCKEKTFLMYNKNIPSPFIKEIKKIVKKQLSKINYFH